MGGHKIPFDFGEQVIGGRELISHTGSMALRRGQATLPPLCSGRYPKQNSYDLKIQGAGSAPPVTDFLRLWPTPHWVSVLTSSLGQSPRIRANWTARQSRRLTSRGKAESKTVPHVWAEPACLV